MWLPIVKKLLHRFTSLQVVSDITAIERNHHISVFDLDYCELVSYLTWNGKHGNEDTRWQPVRSNDGFTGTLATTA
jgi:hypothetical protein